MVFEVFSYWNIKELQLVFNAVAAVVGSGDYLGLAKTLILVGMLSFAMAVLAGFSQLPDFGRWVIMLAVFNGMLLVPKANVVLVDRTGTQAPVTVANVPIGLAAFAHSVSHVGDWLTNAYETTFSLPADIQFRTNGTLFGHRVQQEVLHTKFDSSILNSNLLEFYRECVIPEFATGWIVASDMAKSNDIWTYLNGKTNPGRLVTIRGLPGAAVAKETYGCAVAYTALTGQITAVNTQQMNTLGKRLYPGLSTAAANAAIQGAIQTSTNYMLGISTTAMDITKQAAMSNFMIDAQYMLPAQIGDAAGAAANLGQAQAIRSTSDSYKMMAKLGESTMPKVKNIIEIIQYSVFPIIMLLILMAGHKGGLVIKAYVMSLAWVQLWPPLYAVMHMIMTLHAQELAAMTSGMGLSMSQYNMLNNAYISDEAIAGMIAATAIPAIAAAIVKGGDVGAQAIAGMVTPSREAEKIASGMSAGNMQMGSASFGNQSADSLSMGQYNARPTIRQGGFESTGADNVKRFYGRDSAGNAQQVNDASGAIHNLPVKLNMGSKVAGSLERESETQEKASLQQSTSARDGYGATFTQSAAFDAGHRKGSAAGHQDLTSSQAQYLQAFDNAKRVTDQYAKEHGLTQSQSAELAANAALEASGGLNVFGNGATATAGTSARASSSSQTAQMQKAAHALAEDKTFRDSVSKMKTAAQQDTFTQGDEATRSAAKGIRSTLDHTKNYETSAKAAHDKSVAFKEESKRTRDNSASYDANYTNEFVGWMTNQQDRNGHRFTTDDVTDMALHDKGLLEQYKDRFVNEQLVPKIDQAMPAPENTVAAQHEQNTQEVGSKEQVVDFNAQNNAVVAGKAEAAGVNPDKTPENRVVGAVHTMQAGASGDIAAGSTAIDKEGNPIKADAVKNTDPTQTNNMGLAAQNAAANVLPDGTTKLLDKMGMVSDNASVAKPTADNYTGTTTDAIVDTAVFAGTFALGGVGGKVGGKVLAEGKAFALGEKAGNVAEATALKVADITEQRAAGMAAARAEGTVVKAEVAATPEAEAAATKAAAARQEAIDRGAARKGAEAEVGTTNTLTGAGMVGGAIAGGAAGNYLTSSEHGDTGKQVVEGVIQGAKKVDDFGMEVGRGAVKAADDLGNTIKDASKK